MSTTTLQFELRQGGALTDPDGNSVLLRDATGTYGARRTDTLATVVAAGTPMTRQSAGVYTYSVADPAPGLTYQWVAEYAVNGVPKHDTFTAYAYGSGLAGFWTTQARIQRKFGIENSGAAIDLENDGTGVAAAWQQVLDDTDVQVDLIFLTEGYNRPTSFTTVEFKAVQRLATIIGINEAWMARGQTETNAAGGANVGGVYAKAAAEAIASLEELAAAGVPFPEIVDTAGEVVGTAPQILRPTMDDEGRPLAIAGQFDRPYFDPNAGGWRW